MAADLNIVVKGTPVPVYLGENTALSLAAKNSAAASAAAAALSEATAESAAGPTYPDTAAGLAATADGQEIGRASCRDRVCPYVEIPVVAVSSQKKIKNRHYTNSKSTVQ